LSTQGSSEGSSSGDPKQQDAVYEGTEYGDGSADASQQNDYVPRHFPPALPCSLRAVSNGQERS
jgi:hypothetical protein